MILYFSHVKFCLFYENNNKNRINSVFFNFIAGSHDTTIRLWDLVAGKTRVTLTNHKKSVRAVILHPRQ